MGKNLDAKMRQDRWVKSNRAFIEYMKKPIKLGTGSTGPEGYTKKQLEFINKQIRENYGR